MKIILVFVSTLDGKITKWNNPEVWSWSSKEDQLYFTDLWENSRLLVMGSNTFKTEPVKPSSGQRIIVLTSHPEKYKSFQIPGQIEFLNMIPSELVYQFNQEGYELMTVVGGAHLATSFLKEQLIDELWLTIEPKIFGIGDNFVIPDKLDISLRLLECRRINDQGTLITKYAVIKN